MTDPNCQKPTLVEDTLRILHAQALAHHHFGPGRMGIGLIWHDGRTHRFVHHEPVDDLVRAWTALQQYLVSFIAKQKHLGLTYGQDLFRFLAWIVRLTALCKCGTMCPQGAGITARPCSDTDHGTQVHHRLIEISHAPFGRQSMRVLPQVLRHRVFARPAWHGKHPRQNAFHIAI